MTNRRRVPALPVGWLSLAAFLIVLTLLAVQLRAGHDPALGGQKAKAVAPRRVVVRKIVRRVVVVHVIPSPASSSGTGSQSSAPAGSSSTPVVSSAPAPAPAAAAPAPAPAPVTRSS